jgi:hypothetical protein
MRRIVLVDTRSVIAASATVSKGPKDDGPMQTSQPFVETDGPRAIGAVSLRSSVSKDSVAQEGIVPGDFDGDWV